jgi:hypothetical protein
LLELIQGVFPDDEQKLKRRWRELEETFGPEVRDGVQQGLRQLWRTHPPLEQADRPNDVFARTVAGLLGLNEELSDRVVVEQLSDAEATRALEYSLFNANSFSKWVNDLIENRFALCDAFYGATIAAGTARRPPCGMRATPSPGCRHASPRTGCRPALRHGPSCAPATGGANLAWNAC